MITRDEILRLHARSLADYGGGPGIRDEGLLASALSRPFQTFAGEELYKTPFEKAAALGESLIVNHPFVDGNKRTGLLGMLVLLNRYQKSVTVAETALYDFVISIATGAETTESITAWLEAHSVPRPR